MNMSDSQRPDRPSYLGLLNAIAVGEARGAALLDAWIPATRDPDVAALLRRVAIREHEHAAAFAKRLCELGYTVEPAPLGDYEEQLALMRSSASDREKFERLFGFGGPPEPDSLARVFDDRTIDPETGALLGRFIAEERDSERRLEACWESLRRGHAVETSDPLEAIDARLARLTATIEELKALRRPTD
jgi:hypothetical protein